MFVPSITISHPRGLVEAWSPEPDARCASALVAFFAIRHQHFPRIDIRHSSKSWQEGPAVSLRDRQRWRLPEVSRYLDFSPQAFRRVLKLRTHRINIVGRLARRNQTRGRRAIDGEPASAGAASFDDARLSFVARVVSEPCRLARRRAAIVSLRRRSCGRAARDRSSKHWAWGEQFYHHNRAPNTSSICRPRARAIRRSIERSV
jgi:hypothetical protein